MGTRKTNDGFEIIKSRFGLDPRTDPGIQAFADDFRIAQMIYDGRRSARMTQKELAEAIGATESVIAQLEDADYEGHSLSMLRRIADALHLKLRVEFVQADA